MSIEQVLGYAVVAFVILVALGTYAQGGIGAVRSRLSQRRIDRRVRRAELAAVEAAIDDAGFDPGFVRSEIGSIVGLQQRYRETQDPTVFDGRADSAELLAWAQRVDGTLDEGGGFGQPDSRILSVTNRPGVGRDRVEALVSIPARGTRLEQRWILGRREGGWSLLAVRVDPRSSFVASQPLIANEWEDEQQLHGEAVRELADQTPLAVVDDRYSPMVVDAVVNRLLSAWEEAAQGDPALLERLAEPQAAVDLLHPPRLRSATMVVLDLRCESLDVTAIASGRIDLALELTAVRYLIGGDRSRIAGSVEHRHVIRVDWRLKLLATTDPLWQLESTTDPSVDIPGPYDAPPRRPSLWRRLLSLGSDPL